ncbi:MAG: hypothetical protein V3571_15730 [Pseudodesulfovibrio sp.]
MKIESGSGIKLNFSLVKDTLQAGAADAESALAAAPADVLAGHQVRGDLMEGSFVDTDSEASRYIQATMIGLKVDSQFRNKMNGLLETYQLQAAAADNYAERSLAGRKAAEAVGDMVDGEVSEAEASRMEKEREELEEQIEKKLEEKASGEGETPGAGTAEGAEPAAEGETADVPETSAAAGETGTVAEDVATRQPVSATQDDVATRQPVAATLEDAIPQQGLDVIV